MEVNMVSNVGAFSYNPACCGYGYGYDYDNIDLDYSTYPMGTMPMAGGSIFNTMPMIGGGGYNNQAYFDNMKQYQQFYNDYYIDQQKMYRNQNLRVQAPMEAIQGRYVILKDKIMRGEEDQVMKAFRDFRDAVANAYGPGSAAEVGARASMIYAQLNGGKSLIEDVRENCKGSVGTGLTSALTFGWSDKTSAEEIVAEATGSEIGSKEKDKKRAGRVAGAATAGAAAGILSKFLLKGKGGPIGFIIGAGAFVLSLFASKSKN